MTQTNRYATELLYTRASLFTHHNLPRPYISFFFLVRSITQRHPLNPIDQRPPAISLQLRILHPLLRPLLMRPRDPPDHALEEQHLVPHALLDEHAARVLVDDRLLVLFKPPLLAKGQTLVN